MSSCGCIGGLWETGRIGAKVLSVEWKIPDVLTLPGKNHNFYTSPKFIIGNNCCKLRLWPNWKRKEAHPTSGFMRLALEIFAPKDFRKTFRISFGIRVNREVKKRMVRDWVFKTKRSYRCYNICRRSELMSSDSKLMLEDKLRIVCTVRRVKPSVSTGLSHDVKNNIKVDEDDDKASSDKNIIQPNLVKNAKIGSSDDIEGNNSEDNYEDDDKVSERKNEVKQQNVAKNAEKRLALLVTDLGRLLLSGENSDVTVQVGDVEFKVHRNILCARSPVLAAMMKHKTTEGIMDKISICDCEPEVFKEYLLYLYTGSVELLSELNVFQLYRVANNYLADELKEQCLIHIQGILSLQTFCDTVKMALIYGESSLLEQAIDFATENIRSIVRTKEWQDFNREYPSEANEVLIKALGPPSASHKSKRQKTKEKACSSS